MAYTRWQCSYFQFFCLLQHWRWREESSFGRILFTSSKGFVSPYLLWSKCSFFLFLYMKCICIWWEIQFYVQGKRANLSTSVAFSDKNKIEIKTSGFKERFHLYISKIWNIFTSFSPSSNRFMVWTHLDIIYCKFISGINLIFLAMFISL